MTGSGREAFDWDRVSEDWERFQQQDNWREKIALMEAENPSRSQVAKAAAKKLKRRQGPSEDGVTHHDIDYYYDGLNELKRSFCDLVRHAPPRDCTAAANTYSSLGEGHGVSLTLWNTQHHLHGS